MSETKVSPKVSKKCFLNELKIITQYVCFKLGLTPFKLDHMWLLHPNFKENLSSVAGVLG